MENFRHKLDRFIRTALLPRLLTQACRDPFSAVYGCFDRDWWHYKIRDFPSIILQQGGYTLALAEESGFLPRQQNYNLVQASALLWARRVMRYGSLEEYYPWEDGYPPLAFSTLAMAKLCLSGGLPTDKLEEAFCRSARKLISRFESRALNQQMAGLAALAALRKIQPTWVSEDAFSSLASMTLCQQKEDGWFPEYEGPDLGYLSVTLDCLWDLYEITKEPMFFESACRSFDFLDEMTQLPFGGLGMHQARNTDYLVPYGLCRFSAVSRSWSLRVSSLLERVYMSSAPYAVSFDSIDDRYLCHYIGHSLIRAWKTLAAEQNPSDVAARAETKPSLPASPKSAGISGIVHSLGHPSILCCTHKGGTFTCLWNSSSWVADYGWVVKRGDRLWSTHGWSTNWKVRVVENEWEITGHLFPHQESLPSPWNHLVLRILALISGRYLIGWLKQQLIFKGADKHLPCRRIIRRVGQCVEVEDWIGNILPSDVIHPAPRASIRHVASADTWHPEDFTLLQNVERISKQNQSKDGRLIHTRYVEIKPA